MKTIKKLLSLTLATIIMVSMLTAHAEETEESHGTGLQAMTEDRRNELMKHAITHTDDEPIKYSNVTSVDNSNTDYFPSIANQGKDGACVAYATTYYQLSYTISKALNADCSNYTFSPNWTYSLINSGVDEGSYEGDAYKILSDFGAPKKSEFTGTKTSIETQASVWKSAMKYKIDPDKDNDNWKMDYFNNTDDFIVSAKQKLADGKVLTTGTDSYWWYGDDSNESVTAKVTVDGTTKNQKGIAYIYDNGKDEGRHLITIVGYDDNVKFSYGNYSTTGGFKIANSWGTSWGNSGYIWVAYDAFYKNSANRPKERNGYGFVSSWWNENSDENVYYTINLDENYAPYQASYIGELSLSSKKLSSTHLTYATKENLEAELSHENDIFNGENYANIYGLPTKFYTGTIALDLSDMSYYMDNSDAYWEICLNGITAGKLKVIDSDSNVILSSTSGTKWVKPHEHIYTEGEMTYNESQWTRNDTCNICNEVNTVNGACYFNMDFENGVNASDWINNGRGVISSSSDDNNTYMQINYVNESGDKPNYFEISNPTNWYYSNTKISGLTEMSFDVKFGGIDGDIYLKQRAEDINKIVLRICCKEVGRLQYGTNGGRRTFFDENEQYINPIDRWLHIRIIANISENNDEAKQTIYVTDRNTGELISTVENKALASDVSYCNMITIGGSSEVDIDNIIVRDVK